MNSWNPKRLNEVMVLCKLSNADLGKKVGVNWQTIARWRNDYNKGKFEGKFEPTSEQIWRISAITKFPYKHFVTEDNFDFKSNGIFY